MCLAIVVDSGFIDEEIGEVLESIDNAWEDNPDGGGLAWVEDNAIVMEKGFFDKELFKDRVCEVLTSCNNTDILIHLRFASAGEVSVDNCHPFKIDDDKYFIHNGTITRFKTTLKDTESDTVKFGKFMEKLPSDFPEYAGYVDLIEDYVGISRICILQDTGLTTIYNEHYGTCVGSVWYSNDYFKKEVVRKVSTISNGYSATKLCTCGEPLVSYDEKSAAKCYECMYRLYK